MRRASSVMLTSKVKNLLNLSLMMLSLINLMLFIYAKARVAIFTTCLRITHVVCANDLAPVGTMLVTAAAHHQTANEVIGLQK